MNKGIERRWVLYGMEAGKTKTFSVEGEGYKDETRRSSSHDSAHAREVTEEVMRETRERPQATGRRLGRANTVSPARTRPSRLKVVGSGRAS